MTGSSLLELLSTCNKKQTSQPSASVTQRPAEQKRGKLRKDAASYAYRWSVNIQVKAVFFSNSLARDHDLELDAFWTKSRRLSNAIPGLGQCRRLKHGKIQYRTMYS